MAKPRGMASGGRPCMFSDEITEIIKESIIAGLTLEGAAAAAGISYDALNEWRKRGEAGDERFVKFCEMLKSAKYVGQKELALKIRKAADHSWQAAAWLLERRHHDVWGRKDIAVIEGGNVQINVNVSTKEEALKEIEAIETGLLSAK